MKSCNLIIEHEYRRNRLGIDEEKEIDLWEEKDILVRSQLCDILIKNLKFIAIASFYFFIFILYVL